MTNTEITERAANVRKQNRLTWYEEQIQMRGKALASIFKQLHDDPEKPYLLHHASWEAYCADRWHISPSRGWQLLASENVREQLADAPETAALAPQLSERQLREVVTVPAPRRVEVVLAAVAANPKLPARAIKRARAMIIDGETGEPEAVCPRCHRPL